ncbi:MAG: hypothetical protein IEMM0008_0861 [bacterium]|nr:MAG: hypothetical protein IEMM0008_0861 [bacterium]
MKILQYTLAMVFIINFAILSVAQTDNNETKTAKEIVAPKFYRTIKEHFFKEDEFISENNEIADNQFDIVNTDEKAIDKFYAVQYKKIGGKDRPVSVSYYKRNKEKNTLNRVEAANFENLHYYSINYVYENGLLLKKMLKDQNNMVTYEYRYFYDERAIKKTGATESDDSTKKPIRKVEKWGRPEYRGELELKSYKEFTWDGGNLKTLDYHDKSRRLVERYTFKKSPDPDDSRQNPEYLVGNNKISLLVIENYDLVIDRYERFKLNPNKVGERSFYVIYDDKDDKILQKIYNDDNVLIEIIPIDKKIKKA